MSKRLRLGDNYKHPFLVKGGIGPILELMRKKDAYGSYFCDGEAGAI